MEQLIRSAELRLAHLKVPLTLRLPGGNLWVGFAAEGAALQVGDAASGVFAPSAVVIGLAG